MNLQLKREAWAAGVDLGTVRTDMKVGQITDGETKEMKRRKREEKRGKRRRGEEGKTDNNIRGPRLGREESVPTNQKKQIERERG